MHIIALLTRDNHDYSTLVNFCKITIYRSLSIRSNTKSDF